MKFLAVSSAVAALLVASAWTIVGQTAGAPLTAPPSTPQSVQAGEAIFKEYCGGCHGRRADGKGPQATNLKPRPQNLRNAQFVKYLTDDRMFTSISGGVRGTAMPAFEMTLSPEKRWQAIHYIRSLTASDTMRIPNGLVYQNVAADIKNPLATNDSTTGRGRWVFMQYCASCHGPKADGNGRLAEMLTPMPRNLAAVASWGEKPFIEYLNDARVYSSITNGVPGTSMQPWGAALSDNDRWAAITWLRAEAARASAAARQ